MSQKEIKQIAVFEQLKRQEIDFEEAALIVRLSTRQVRRKLVRYVQNGAEGLIHKSRGKPSKRSTSNQEQIIELVRTLYHDFGPTFAAEKLMEEHEIVIHHETLRLLMIRAGIWHKKRKRSNHRKWREPKANRGAMVQFDGSEHAWFEDRGEMCTLLKFVDDATREMLWMEFATSESNRSVMTATKNYFKKHGRPLLIYADCGKTFRVNFNNHDGRRSTQYKKALQDLDVTLQNAYSPQAKGRIERSFQTDQDRLVKELRLKNISNIEDANRFLRDYYLPKYGKKYAVKPKKSKDLHRPIEGYDMNHIFSIRSERILGQDFTIHYKNRLFQLSKAQPAILYPKDKIMVLEGLDGKIAFQIRGLKLKHIEIRNRKELMHYKPAKKQPNYTISMN